jgi:Ca2+-binding RTX toxin-like protein
VDNTSDVITEASSEGTDTIQSSVTFTASAHVENLTLTGSAAINGTGNTLDNNITGNSGINNLSGGDGNDLLFGGLGNDTLTGGSGQDIFLLNTTLNATSNRDTITDFSHSDDTIQLSKSVMTGLGAFGELSIDHFKVTSGVGLGTIITGYTAIDSTDRIIYNQTSGALFYDRDGSGNSAAVQIAIIGNLPTDMDHTDFVVI